MDPCPFVRLMVGNLALNIPVGSKPSRPGVHPSTTSCFCKIKLNNQPCQMAVVPLDNPCSTNPAVHLSPDQMSLTLAASFGLSKSDVEKLAGKSVLIARKKPMVKVEVYCGSMGASCSRSTGRLLGKVSLPVDLKGVEGTACVFHDGWVSLGKERREGDAQVPAVHVTVMSEPDPRFVFEFDGEPECSPQVFQVQGSMRQPMFTCKFNVRNPSVRIPSLRSRSRKWLGSFGSEKERAGKERKGWAVTVHDLSGSAVAFASMTTPFVASSGSDRVSRSNPGAWLIFRPGEGTWKPWGRLEAWRRGVRGGGTSTDELGCRFELVPDGNMGGGSINALLVETTLSTNNGGKFYIDLTGNNDNINDQTRSLSTSPGCSPRFSSGRFETPHGYRGFVMSSTVQGEGKCSKPTVEIGVQNVGCAEDAAAFVALAAVVDLSMDACKLFSHKLRKELSVHGDVALNI